MSNKHTPGPWHVEKHGCTYEIWPKDSGQTHTNLGTARTKADATLIAAAPDLLAALKEMLSIDDWQDEEIAPKQLINKARAAIAKAEAP